MPEHLQIPAQQGSLQKKVIDVMALAGDAADNVPGCPGIGLKTAGRLITKFGSLNALICIVGLTNYTDAVLTPRMAQLIDDNIEDILTSRELVRLDGVPCWAALKYGASS